MQRLMYKAFLRKFLGIHFERAGKSLMICLILYFSLRASDMEIQIAPFILYLIASVHTAGVMWRALSSRDHAAYLKNMRMLPLENRDFVFTWVSSLGLYTFTMQTGPLLSVIWAVSSSDGMEILRSIFCAVNAIIVTALVYSRKTRSLAVLLWAGISFTCPLFLHHSALFLPVIAVNLPVILLCLVRTDADAFFPQYRKNSRTWKTQQHCPVIPYLLRYLVSHPHYLFNTFLMWGIAGILPLFFRQMEGLHFFPVGFAILSLNTPMGILLSCDPELEQAVRILPEQGRRFCLPYAIFVSLCNLTADTVFLCSWRLLNGPVPLWAPGTAVLFSVFSAAGTVWLEWFYPIRNWKMESDLWHHPRKYAVPVVLLLAAGILSI